MEKKKKQPKELKKVDWFRRMKGANEDTTEDGNRGMVREDGLQRDKLSFYQRLRDISWNVPKHEITNWESVEMLMKWQNAKMCLIFKR